MSALLKLKDSLYDAIPNGIKLEFLKAVFLIKHPRFLTSVPQSINKKKPVFILSIPRNGSTWTGDVMSYSDKCLYLKEPINVQYRYKNLTTQTVATLEALADGKYYTRLIRQSLSGHPKFIKSVVTEPTRWYEKNSDFVRVIKDVNPLVLDHLLTFEPKLVFLTRHPCAVANSYYRMGWKANQFKKAFTKQQFQQIESKYKVFDDEDFWVNFGNFQAVIELIALESLKSYPLKKIVKYEDICAAPVEEFHKLYQFCELPFTHDVEDKIVDSTSAGDANYIVGQYDTKRDSANMAYKWKSLLTQEQIEKVKKGYSISSRLTYLEDFD